jgi:cytochrome c
MRFSAVALFVLVLTGGAAAQQGDPVEGEAEIRKCLSCPSIGENAANKIGPVLNGVFGRQAGTYPGFNYSQDVIDAGKKGLIWSPGTVSEWITAPKAMLPGTKMNFAGVRNDQERADIIAYLLTLSPDYQPAKTK